MRIRDAMLALTATVVAGSALAAAATPAAAQDYRSAYAPPPTYDRGAYDHGASDHRAYDHGPDLDRGPGFGHGPQFDRFAPPPPPEEIGYGFRPELHRDYYDWRRAEYLRRHHYWHAYYEGDHPYWR